jgi:hypothetical protein
MHNSAFASATNARQGDQSQMMLFFGWRRRRIVTLLYAAMRDFADFRHMRYLFAPARCSYRNSTYDQSLLGIAYFRMMDKETFAY